MQTKIIKTVLACLATLGCIYTFAQVKPAIVGVAKVRANKIMLRWTVNDYKLFQQFVQQGVLIYRQELDTSNNATSGWQRVTADTIKAWPLEEFRQAAQQKDTGKIIIAQCIYGKPSAGKGGIVDNLKKQDEEMENKFAILSLYSSLKANNAVAAGLGFEDLIKPDTAKNYLYRIVPCGKTGMAGIDTGYVRAVGRNLLVETRVVAPLAEGLDKKILLSWPAPLNLFAAYYIARSADTGTAKTYHYLTSLPFLPRKDSLNGRMMYTYADSVENNRNYFYKIYGADAFGDTVSAGYPVFARARDLTPPTPLQLSFTKKNNNVVFSWNKTTDGDLKGIYLVEGRAMNRIDSILTKQPLRPSEQTYSINLDEKKLSSAYFRLALVDTNGNHSYSNHVYVFLPDKTPPAIPYDLQGKIDSLGAVKITWMPDSTEALRGYKLLTSNDAVHFVNLTDMIQDTTYNYATTIKTLSKDIYFEVVAIDGSYNHSDPSQPLHLTRPLKLKPVRPVIIDMKAGIKAVDLKWSDTHSEEFAHFTVLKKNESDKSWAVLANTSLPAYKDTAIMPNQKYEYAVVEVSTQNVISDTAYPVLAIIGNQTPSNDFEVKQTRNNDQKTYLLTWSQPAKAVNFFVVYKNNGPGFTMYRSVPGANSSFTDNANVDKDVRYAVEVHYADKTVSDLIDAQ